MNSIKRNDTLQFKYILDLTFYQEKLGKESHASTPVCTLHQSIMGVTLLSMKTNGHLMMFSFR